MTSHRTQNSKEKGEAAAINNSSGIEEASRAVAKRYCQYNSTSPPKTPGSAMPTRCQEAATHGGHEKEKDELLQEI